MSVIISSDSIIRPRPESPCHTSLMKLFRRAHGIGIFGCDLPGQGHGLFIGLFTDVCHQIQSGRFFTFDGFTRKDQFFGHVNRYDIADGLRHAHIRNQSPSHFHDGEFGIRCAEANVGPQGDL